VFNEFREFAMRGSLIDMAVGIVLGLAFGTIITSLVKDVIMPPVGMLLGHADFSNMFVVLADGAKQAGPYATVKAAQDAGATTINYGLFINTVINFIIVAFVMFLIVRTANRMRKPAPAPAETVDCPFCLSTIPAKATRCPNCTSELQKA
jgi:large conductance mechanosensitive channel